LHDPQFPQLPGALLALLAAESRFCVQSHRIKRGSQLSVSNCLAQLYMQKKTVIFTRAEAKNLTYNDDLALSYTYKEIQHNLYRQLHLQ